MAEKDIEYLKDSEISSVKVEALNSSDEKPQLKGWAKFTDSFKPFDGEQAGLDPNLTEAQKIAVMTANSPLSRSLKNRHLQMIAIGGSIGTGLFVGSGKVLKSGGPGGLVLAYILIGSMIFCTVHSLGELSVTFPVSGSFVTYNNRFIDESWGFAMAWNYALQWLIVLPLELVVAAILIRYWNKSVSAAAWVTIFWILIAGINLFGIRGYGESEFIFSIIKVIAIVGWIIMGIVLICGGARTDGIIGTLYVGTSIFNQKPFANGFKGVASVFVTAAFSFAGVELAGLSASETKDPRKSMPKAIKQVFWRITLFYVVSLVIVGCLVPYDDPNLGTSGHDASASPFIIAIVNGGIKGLPSVFNAVIMLAVLSVGNSSVFASSRTLCALAVSGMAPKWMGYIDKNGRPLGAILFQLTMGLLCYLAASDKYGEVFNWMLAISGLSSVFTWGSINLAFIRFRHTLKYQGRDTNELTFVSQAGYYGAWWGMGFNILVLCAQFWVAVWPIKEKPSAEAFFSAFLSLPIFLVFYIGHKIWTKNWKLYILIKDIDIDTGRRDLDLDLLKQEIAEEKAYNKTLPFYKRIYKILC